jgi:hypothetical protein
MPDEPLFAEPSRAESVAERPARRDSRPAVERNGPEPTPGTGEAAPGRKKRKGWYAVIPFALARRADLPAPAKLLLARLRDLLGHNPERTPGQRFLCDELGFTSRRALNTATRKLEAAGLLVVRRAKRRNAGNGVRTTPFGTARADRKNVYTLTAAALELFRPPSDANGDETPPLKAANGGTLTPFEPTNGDEMTPLNGTESAPLESERCQSDTTNGVILNPPTVSKRPQQTDCTDRPIRQTKKKAAIAADSWALAQAAMKGNTLRTDAFRAAWLSWVEYRRQAGKRLAAATAQRQIRKLEGFGHDGAIASIEQSIGNGWQGLFDPDGDRGGRGGNCGTNRRGRVEPEPGKYARSVRLFVGQGNHPAGTDAASGHEANPPARCPHT